MNISEIRNTLLKIHAYFADCYDNAADGSGAKAVFDRYMEAVDYAESRLAAQEARVMTLEEAIEAVSKDGSVVWIEQKSHPLEVAHVFPTNHICDSPQRKFQDYGKKFVPKRYSYRYMWRCWTSKPTDKQREATPWE